MTSELTEFDRVVLDLGGRRNLTPAQYFALPLSDRVRYLLERRITFYRDGRALDTQNVLASLRKLRTSVG